jgi:hypothetical protein
VSKKVSMASRRFARGTVVTGLLMLAAAPLALTACSSAPSPTPDISPNPAIAPHDERITLPETMGLALRHPAPADRTEHQILYTVQQSIRSQLHAEYGPGANDPLLTAYWSGDGLAAVRREVTAWAKRGEQPVGVLVVSNVSYSAPGADGKGTVSYCANWQNVNRGNSATHVVGAAVQQRGTAGTYTTLTFARNTGNRGGRWKVTAMTESPKSPRCPTSGH